ncbi:MAG: hypothetical protein WDN28_21725 [Chthoniobacter sp.]
MIQDTFKEIAKPADFVTAWSKFLHDGFLADSAAKVEALTFNASSAAKFITDKFSTPAGGEDAYEVVFTPCPKVDDGRYNNNGWQQEIPDPITKLTWDNAAQISTTTARKLDIDNGDIVQILLEKRSLSIPVIIAPVMRTIR